jgi:hypothetical protein
MCYRIGSSAPPGWVLLREYIGTELLPVDLIKHDLHVRTGRWHASGTSRGGLRSRTLVSTQHIVSTH